MDRTRRVASFLRPRGAMPSPADTLPNKAQLLAAR
jgi:hypothetical protein